MERASSGFDDPVNNTIGPYWPTDMFVYFDARLLVGGRALWLRISAFAPTLAEKKFFFLTTGHALVPPILRTMLPNATTKMLAVRYSDGEEAMVDREAWSSMCATIKHLLDDTVGPGDGASDMGVVPLPNVESNVGALVNEYISLCYDQLGGEVLNVDSDEDKGDDDDEGGEGGGARPVHEFEMAFLAPMNLVQVKELGDAANFLDCSWLLDACQEYIARLADETVQTAPIPRRADGAQPTALDVMRAQVNALRDLLNIESDFTTEEEEAALRENEWCYDLVTSNTTSVPAAVSTTTGDAGQNSVEQK